MLAIELNKWKWRNKGSKLHVVDGLEIRRIYYGCVSCTARAQRDSDPNGALTIRIYGEHNHQPPLMPPKPARELRREGIQRMLHGQKPARAHQQMVLAHPGEVVPSIKSMTNAKHYRKRSLLSHPSLFVNLAEYHPGFVQWFELIPSIMLLLASPESLDLLQSAQAVFIDGTFDFAERNLILTTILVVVNGELLPAVFLLHEHRNQETYIAFFRRLQSLASRFRPEVFFADFEGPIRSGFQVVWPNASFYGDAFHFVYDNQKWLRRHGK